MSENILDSYLVKLGSTVDTSSFDKFNNTLKGSERIVDSYVTSAARGFIKLESTIVGAFASFGLGMIFLMDKTAMADQRYRLFGMRMLMGKDAARAMSMATDDLGASLDQIAYDPELNKRFQYLYEQEVKLGKTLGPGFNDATMAMRGLRTEYKFFGDEVEVLGMGIISKFFNKLGYGSGDLLSNLDHLTDWFMGNIPKWSDEISDDLIPAWNDTVDVTKDWGKNIEMVAGDFQLLLGILTGDESLQTTTISVESLAKSFEHLVDAAKAFSDVGSVAIKTSLHGIASLALSAASAMAYLKGDKAESSKLWNDSLREGMMEKEDAKALLGIGSIRYNSDLDGTPKELDGSLGGTRRRTGSEFVVPDNLKVALADPRFLKLMHGIAMVESSNRQFDINGRPILGPDKDNFGRPLKERAIGRYQLFQSTASKYGLDANDDKQNTLAAELLVLDLLKKNRGNVAAALANYGGFKSASPADYIAKVQKYGFQSGYEPSGLTVNGGIHVTVPPHMTAEESKKVISDSLLEFHIKQSRSMMAQTAAGAHF